MTDPLPDLPPALATAVAAAAARIVAADALLITAGAGIGIDSGLPDFRGPNGFWRIYPALAEARLDFTEIACPDAFRHDPALAWGFYGHRLRTYRQTVPHAGFAQLAAIGRRLPHGCFVFTSNVDGQFQQAGFTADRVCECHGSIHHLQCLAGCGEQIWNADAFIPEVDDTRCRLVSPPPRCPHCGALARPNILMFGDGGWLEQRSARQRRALEDWLAGVAAPVVVEIGAGTAVPTVRWFGETLGVPLIRINPDEAEVASARGIALPLGAAAGIAALTAALRASGFLPSKDS